MGDTETRNETDDGFVEIPTYDEYLQQLADGLQQHPAFVLAKGIFRVAQFVIARERAWMDILIDKGVWHAEDSEKLSAKTEEMARNYDKDLIKRVVKTAAEGELKVPIHGKEVTLTPDTAIGLLNEFLLNEKVSPTGIELVAQFLESEEKLKASYEATRKAAEAANELKRSMQKMKESAERRERERAKLRREMREQALRVYLGRCKLADKPAPSQEDQDKMLNGDMPIPGASPLI